MISLKENLQKIGINPGTPVSYSKFQNRPASLREAIRWMTAPHDWFMASDVLRDDYWTDNVQGVGYDGSNWIFSCNANQSKPGSNDKAIYAFPIAQPLGDGKWICRIAYQDIPMPLAGLQGANHWGQLACHDGRVYVAHYWTNPEFPPVSLPPEFYHHSNVVVFKNNGGILQYDGYFPLKVKSSDGQEVYPQFQATNPWDGKLYSCLDGIVREFFIHDPADGTWKDQATFPLSGLLPQSVQGACFSPNGHLYVAQDVRYDDLEGFGRDYKWIFYYSALNGAYLGKIPVYAPESGHELEGLCYGDISTIYGNRVQIHVVLLYDPGAALDNLHLRSFSTNMPEAV